MVVAKVVQLATRTTVEAMAAIRVKVVVVVVAVVARAILPHITKVVAAVAQAIRPNTTNPTAVATSMLQLLPAKARELASAEMPLGVDSLMPVVKAKVFNPGIPLVKATARARVLSPFLVSARRRTAVLASMMASFHPLMTTGHLRIRRRLLLPSCCTRCLLELLLAMSLGGIILHPRLLLRSLHVPCVLSPQAMFVTTILSLRTLLLRAAFLLKQLKRLLMVGE